MREQFADGAKTLHGFFSVGFPNFVELGLSQNAYLINFSYMFDRKARHTARVINHALDHHISTVEPDDTAQTDWVQRTRESGLSWLSYLSACTPGCYSGQGDLQRGFFGDVYRNSEIEFWDMIERWWETGTFEGLQLDSAEMELQG